MISRYDVSLNGVPMSSISQKILILDISYESPSINTETFTVAKRQGARIHRRYIGRNTVRISFAIRAYDTFERQEICKSVARWAKNGGVLQTNDKKGQQLRCVCDSFPTVTSALKWTDTIDVVFSAYVLPFWEEISPSSITLIGTSANGVIYVPGSIDGAMVEVSIKANGSLSTVNLRANNTEMKLSDLSVPSGQTIEISYNDEIIQSIKTGNTSLLNKRTGADDLLANCGEMNTFSISANAPVTATFKVRGLWL